MIEPYSQNIKGPCKLKRHHKLIFEMWYDNKSNQEIAKKLTKKGCYTNRWQVGAYINRCVAEDGKPHDFSMPWPTRKSQRPSSICDKYHDEIAYLRNYMGYSVNEISEKIGISGNTIFSYIYRCLEEEY